MQINVSQLLKTPVGTMRDYDLSETLDASSGGHPVQGRVILTRTNRGILLKGTIYTETGVTCSRCLNLFACPLALSIEEEYFPTTDVISGTPVAIPDEPGCFTIDEHHIIDLTEAILQYALMAVPMKPLCREDCAGLCPVCGRDLNLGNCNCPPQEMDARWSRLRECLSVSPPPSTPHSNRKGEKRS